ncbi:hypothetical protein [Methanobrevibacter sp.]|uniref:hypothetical protein n=1 Tax=Methanobrevibacter sp. TaxID=66852 RepID=UPI0026DFEF31|nr:hypothetical protein [Methanobrevibacter sp.]MDO5860169.1 hypothetical protein [Methanobrevibacter sp.]
MPRVNTNKIQFTVTQIGDNQFQASFVDSNGNLASLLPDRTLTYTTNDGKTLSVTVSGGSGVFTVDANNGDIVKATVDYSSRENVYDGNAPKSNPSNGVTPSYNYPDIPYDSEDEEINNRIAYDGGNGNGNGEGNGNGGSGNSGTSQNGGDNTGNSTHSQQNSPGNNANNPINDVSQSYETETTASAQSASSSGSGDANSAQSQSVAKQIIIEEDEFFRVTGMTFIVLLIILTIGYYYRDDIKEMNSKR